MPSRALIFAIEGYAAETSGVPVNRSGALAEGVAFKNWLEKKWEYEKRPKSETEIIFCSGPVMPDGRRATLEAVRATLLEVGERWRNSTDELFVFMCGLGFSSRGPQPATLLLLSDFALTAPTPAVLNIDEIVAWLRGTLGRGCHYYFGQLSGPPTRPNIAATPALGLPFAKSTTSANIEVSTFSLIDESGWMASTFVKELLDGLKGGARRTIPAEDIEDDEFVVTFESLVQYVRSRLKGQAPTSRSEGTTSIRQACLLNARPVPTNLCHVHVEGATDASAGTLFRWHTAGSGRVAQPFTAPSATLTLPIGTHRIGLRLDASVVLPDAWVDVDLFAGEQTVTFRRIARDGSLPQAVRPRK